MAKRAVDDGHSSPDKGEDVKPFEGNKDTEQKQPILPPDGKHDKKKDTHTNSNQPSNSGDTEGSYPYLVPSNNGGQRLSCVIEKQGVSTSSENMTFSDLDIQKGGGGTGYIVNPNSEKPGLGGQKFKKQTSSEESLKEPITPETMFTKHICRVRAHVKLCPFTAIVSGIEKCGKTTALRYLLNRAVQTKHNQPLSPLVEETYSVEDRECLSCYKVIILGAKPYDALTWLMSTSEADNVVMCLASYFSGLCKKQNQGPPTDYYRLLEFTPLSATSECINVSDPEVSKQIISLYSMLMEEWQKLKENESVQVVMPTGVCLLNIFDVGPSKAAQAFSPFLNKYCKRSLNIACYSGTRDADTLKKEFAEETDHQYYQSKKYQVLKPLSGCVHKQQMVIVTAIDTNSTSQSSQQISGLTEAVQMQMQIGQVYPLQVSEELMEDAKRELEKSVMNASFYDDIPLRYMLLLQRIKANCKSFWMKRGEIESLSKKYTFENGDLERFLQFFSSFGSIFYTHDIPSLREYVIVDIAKFVKQIHSLYKSNTETARYGLFKHKDEEQLKVIFEFLTTLGIAAEVKSNQIVTIQGLSLDTATFYYYIPSARSYPEHDTTADTWLSPDVPVLNSIEFISLNGYSKENLQAVLCEHFLLSADCLLIPKESINTTAIRFCSDGSGEDIQFTDVGNKVMMSSLNMSVISEKKKEEIYNRIFTANTPQNVQRQQLVEALGRVKNKHSTIQPQKMIAYAKTLYTQNRDLSSLAPKFNLSQEWLQQHMQNKDMTECEVILCMLLEFKQRTTHDNFERVLQELGIQIS